MPIIQDPRQNPKERLYGIIEVDGVNCFYNKENRTKRKRYMPGGFFVPNHWITLKENKNPNKLIIYQGKVLEIEADFDLPADYNVSTDVNQGPVIKGLFNFAETQPGGLKDLVKKNLLDTELT